MVERLAIAFAVLCACGDDGSSATDGGGGDGSGSDTGDGGGTGTSPVIGGCAILPPDHLFNTPIADLPAEHAMSDTWIALIGNSTRVHLDLGTETDQTSDEFYGIPYNLVHGDALTWPVVPFTSADPDLDWEPGPEADCADAQRQVISPCTTATPRLPFPDDALVEGGVNTSADHLPYGDHHILALDVDTCRLWEGFHVYRTGGQWQAFGAATFDLASNALRTAGWTSADAAGFPILPLLLRPEEAASGVIEHALRFTIPSGSIRGEYTWPARHKTGNNLSQDRPPMGQLFRLKASFQIPAAWSTQSKAIATALKTYGMYLADGGSPWYITGAPGAWDEAVFDEIQSITGDQFEAVDLRPIIERAGFDADSARVPPP